MKRQTQLLGVRNWYGDAFVSLQEEPLKVIDSFFSQYGAFVLSGCEVKANGNKYDIAPGLVALEGAGADNATVKVVVPFAGAAATALPVYLTLGYEIETDVYNDGNIKPVAHIYKAVATTVKPAGSYVRIDQTGGLRFVDAIQDARHRFITDNERTSWNGKAPNREATTVANGLMSAADKRKIGFCAAIGVPSDVSVSKTNISLREILYPDVVNGSWKTKTVAPASGSSVLITNETPEAENLPAEITVVVIKPDLGKTFTVTTSFVGISQSVQIPATHSRAVLRYVLQVGYYACIGVYTY